MCKVLVLSWIPLRAKTLRDLQEIVLLKRKKQGIQNKSWRVISDILIQVIHRTFILKLQKNKIQSMINIKKVKN